MNIFRGIIFSLLICNINFVLSCLETTFLTVINSFNRLSFRLPLVAEAFIYGKLDEPEKEKRYFI